jgi:hypothetical protein
MTENTATEQAFEIPRHGEFCWTEIATDNAPLCRKFYEDVFGWQFVKSEAADGAGIEYLEFGTTAAKQFGGLFQMNPDWYGGNLPKPHMNIYVAADDVDARAKQAVELGGTIAGEPSDVPNVGRMCQIQDPTGAKFFVVKLQS